MAQIKTREQAGTLGTRNSVNGEALGPGKLQSLVSGQCLGAARILFVLVSMAVYLLFLFCAPGDGGKKESKFLSCRTQVSQSVSHARLK